MNSTVSGDFQRKGKIKGMTCVLTYFLVVMKLIEVKCHMIMFQILILKHSPNMQ